MKSSRRRSDNVVDIRPVDPETTAIATTTGVSDEQIAQRAYELYCARGCGDGHDLDDWHQAERELRGNASSSAA
jgi:hypothetical protein